MSGQDIALSLEKREVMGKAVKQLRRDGFVPAVIHDHGKPSRVVMVPYIAINKVYHEAGKHHALSLNLGDDKILALIKDVDFDPRKHQMRHVVFNAIKADEKVEAEVPLVLEGEIPAEKAGYMVITQLDHVEIEALPKDLIDEIKVDATVLAEIGDKITVADLNVPDGVTILTDAEHPIAAVEETKEQISEEAEPEEGAEGEEGAAEGEESEATEAATEKE
ncbi:hypothetical protein A3D14_00750 [Candidatus Saccharibacteria bacterium RIFCSPHIGHO2_02_FULL_47_12]|nr:MAG: hypothetical protein A3D14_00750 [Candidatus Saccharibacteria bacterium RIFCSPHIGHO2_02_FULL_47_12]